MSESGQIMTGAVIEAIGIKKTFCQGKLDVPVLKGIDLSGWQAAAGGNNAHAVYPDLSLYPCDSVPLHVRRLNNALLRADQIHHLGERNDVHWLAPIIADAEAGFGGNLHACELMRAMLREGAAGVGRAGLDMYQ